MANHVSFKGEQDYFARSNKQHTCYLTHKMCSWAQISRSDFSAGEAAQRALNLSLQDQLVDAVDAGWFHYHAQLHTPDVRRARIGVQIPHCLILSCLFCILPENLLLISPENWNVVVTIAVSLLHKIRHALGSDTQLCLYVCSKLFCLCFISCRLNDHDG